MVLAPVFFVPQGQQAAPAGSGQAVAPAFAATLNNPPPALTGVQVGSFLQGAVIGRAVDGATVVRTAAGNLALITNASLGTGAAVTLQVRSVGAQIVFTLLSADAGLLKQSQTQQASGLANRNAPAANPQATPPHGQPGHAPPTAVIGNRRGALTAATLIRQGGAPLPTPQSQTPGAGGGALSAIAGLAGAGLAAVAPAVSGQQHMAGSPQPGASIAVRIVGVQIPGQPAAPLSTPSLPSAITGTVVGATTIGLPLVETPHGLFSIESRAPFQTGAKLTMELMSVRSPGEVAQAPQGTAGQTLLAAARGFSEMREILAVLANVNPQAAAQIANAIPSPTPHLGAAVLLFIAALRGGDLTGFLPATARGAINAAGRGDLLARLSDKGRSVARMASEPTQGDWRGFVVPIHDGDRMDRLMIYVRDRYAGIEDGDEDRGVRFVVEFGLSRLGEMQLDGLVREKRFDLIVRSQQDLPKTVRAHIIDLHRQAGEITGFHGSAQFTTTDGAPFPVQPLREMGRHVDGFEA